MATITLGELKTLWQNVSDWVKGTDAVSSPKVTVSESLPTGANTIGLVDIGKNVQTSLVSTTDLLNASTVYQSDLIDVSGYARITGTVTSSQAGTLYIEQSSDGTNIDVSKSISVSAGAKIAISEEIVAPKARMRYANGSTNQTSFRLYTFLRRI